MKKNDYGEKSFSTRPYQHVLEPLYAYLLIAAKQYEDVNLAGYYNIGPDEQDCYKTGELVDVFVKHWGKGFNGKTVMTVDLMRLTS